jgi:hypothetical protein
VAGKGFGKFINVTAVGCVGSQSSMTPSRRAERNPTAPTPSSAGKLVGRFEILQCGDELLGYLNRLGIIRQRHRDGSGQGADE